jgi:REP element-mobilizing transposase RayT
VAQAKSNKLERRYGQRHLHFITCSCYRRRPLLGTARKRDAFLRILNEVREGHKFWLVGYVVMPEHIHLLISEPKVGTPSTVMQVLKQRVARRLRRKTRRSPNKNQMCCGPKRRRTLRGVSGSGGFMISMCGVRRRGSRS